MKYEDLRIDVIRLENVDIVTASDPTNGRNGGGGSATNQGGYQQLTEPEPGNATSPPYY